MEPQREAYLLACKRWLLRLKEKPSDPANVTVCRSGFACIEVVDADQASFRAMMVSTCDYLLGQDKTALLRMPREQRIFLEKELGLNAQP